MSDETKAAPAAPPVSPIGTADAPDDSAKAMSKILNILRPLDAETQKRVITAASVLLGLKLT